MRHSPEALAERNLDVKFQREIAEAEKQIYYDQLLETKEYLAINIQKATNGKRKNLDGWIVCGSGLANLPEAKGIKILKRIPVETIPNWFIPAAKGHGKEVIIADIGGQITGIQTGRAHIYDTNNSPQQLRMITSPLRVAKGLGINWMVTTNAAGVLKHNDEHILEVGDIAVDFDFINEMGVSPLTGPNDDRLGPRFPNKAGIADPCLFRRLEAHVPRKNLHLGIYTLADNAPLYEGYADLIQAQYTQLTEQNPEIVSCVGMSFAMDAIVMQHHNNPSIDENGFDRFVPYIGITAVTNTIPPVKAPTISGLLKTAISNPNPTDHEEVLEGGSVAENLLIPAVIAMCSSISENPLGL